MEEDTRELSGSRPFPRQPGLLRRIVDGLRRVQRRPPWRRRPPSSIGRYRVVRKIGEGGMGTVFEAEDEVLGRRVAIKRLKAVDESARARFWREARAVARLSHPNVCQLYEVGEDESGPFLAMELLRGEPLSARLKRKPMTAEEVLPLGAGMLAALHVIHAAGLVHRDLKPSNVYLTPYGPRLLDFGLVRQVSAEMADLLPSQMITPGPAISRTPITDADHLIGTPALHGPRADPGPARGRPRRPLRGRRRALRGARRSAPVLRHAGRRGAERHAAGVAAASSAAPCPARRRAAARAREAAVRPLRDRPGDGRGPARRGRRPGGPPTDLRKRLDVDTGEIFVGREAELAWLQERLDAALKGAGGVVFVTGERGAGKSALVGEMLRRVRASSVPITLVAGRCLEHQGPRDPLQPFLDALGRLFGTSQGRERAVDLVKTWAPRWAC